MKKASLLTSFLLLIGCTTTANLYPVEGPLSEQSPPPVIKAKVTGIMNNTGGIRLVMPDGEMCEGKWSVVAPVAFGYSSGTTTGHAQSGLSSVWGTVFGSAFAVSNVAGENRGEAVIVGGEGTVLQVEFVVGSGTHSGIGVAKDNKGNVYKVLF